MLKKISVILEQPEFLCTKLSKNRKIDGAKILREDIEFLLREAKKQVIMNDQNQSIIHIFNHNYIVDGKKFIEEPIDVYANYLSHEITFLTMPKNNIKNIEQAFINCDVEIERYISCTFALAAELLSNNELQYGSMLVDFGYEKISLGLFKNLSLVHSATLPIGVNHIAKDISKVCLLNLQESEIIRNKIDFSFRNNNELYNENGDLRNVFFIKKFVIVSK
jgi:cell division protein FtsA